MGKSFLLISGKGGVGKSTLTSALGVAAAKAGMRTALVDGDLGLRSLDLLLGMQDRVLFDMVDVVQRRCALDQALVSHPEYPQLHLLVGGQQAKPKDFQPADLKKIIKTLTKRFDLLLVDGPAGLGRGMRSLSGLTDHTVLVATPDPVSLRSVEKLSSLLYAQGLRPELLLNRVIPQSVLGGILPQPSAIAQGLDLPLLGVVEESAHIYTSLLAGQTAAQTGDAALDLALHDIVQRMLGFNNPIKEYVPVRLTWLERIKRWFED